MEKREFGFLQFKEKMMIRHKSFRAPESLKSYIAYTVPLDVYYSAAYYRNPEKEMSKKGWIESDVIFDIDADHLPAPCKTEHDLWRCPACEKRGHGPPPTKCSKCGNTSLRSQSWICEKCLNMAKEETIKLKEILTDEFGIKEENIGINFSGHRGYHVHINEKKTAHFSSEERKEITDYVTGTGFDSSLSFTDLLAEGTKRNYQNRSSTWYQKVVNEALHILTDYDDSYLLSGGYSQTVVEYIVSIRNRIRENPSQKTRILRQLSRRFLQKILNQAVANKTSRVDTVVTTDIHRLIRLPRTLNGKTGLKVIEVHDLASFDPLRESAAITGSTQTIYVEDCPQFRLGNKTYGPYKEEQVNLPIEAALLLLCKERASLKGACNVP